LQCPRADAIKPPSRFAAAVSVKENVPSLAKTLSVNTVHVENGLEMSVQLQILKELRCPEHPWLATKKLGRNTADTICRHLQSLRAI
jgi:hypothetical protein